MNPIKYKNCFWMFVAIITSSCDGLNLVGKSYKREILYKNTTQHSIEVISYSSRSFKDKNNNILLKPLSEAIPFSYYDYNRKTKAIVNYLGFVNFIEDGNYVDSVIVIYDNLIKITHNSKNDFNKHNIINYDYERNLTNGNNYVIAKSKETKHSLEVNYSYTFTEIDFITAKNQ